MTAELKEVDLERRKSVRLLMPISMVKPGKSQAGVSKAGMRFEASVDDTMTEDRKEDGLPPISGPEAQESRGRADIVPEVEGYQVIGRLGQGGMGAVWMPSS